MNSVDGIGLANFPGVLQRVVARGGASSFSGQPSQRESAAVDLLTRNYLSGSATSAKAATVTDLTRFFAGRNVSGVASSLGQNLKSIEGGLAALSAVDAALGKIEGLLKQAQGLIAASVATAVITPAPEPDSVPEPDPEPQIIREYTAAEATGDKSLLTDANAQVQSTKKLPAGNLLTGLLSTGQTLTVTIGGTTSKITFGLAVSTSAQLVTKLDQISGIRAHLAADNHLVIEAAPDENAAAERGFTLGGTANIENKFGIAKAAYSGTSLLTQGLAEGQTLTFKAGEGETQTIIFGYGAGQVSSLAELNQALGALQGVTASINADNRLTFKVDDAQASLTLGGTANVEGVFGLAKGVYAPTVTETIVPPQPPAPVEPPAPPPAPVESPQNLTPAIRKSLASIGKDIEAAIDSANVGGVNLLRSGAVEIRFDGESAGFRVGEGASFNLSSLGLEGLASDAASRASLDAAVTNALQQVDDQEAQFARDRAVFETRLEFGDMKLSALDGLLTAQKPAEPENPADTAQPDIGRIAAETRKLFAESLRRGEDGIVENDRAVLEELFSAPLEKQTP